MAKLPKPYNTGSPETVSPSEMDRNEQNGALPVVGIGASAGGLEAVTALLRALPPDAPMAYVLVQHLEARQGGMFIELLQRATKMRVAIVTEGTLIQPGHLYVNPPETYMRVEDGALRLEAHSATPHMPVDHFFSSLADAVGSLSIGVVLSGASNDGTLGLKSIKEAGGITFAQNDTAKHPGMPQSAVSARCVDFVLPPDAIAGELVRLSGHPYLHGDGSDSTAPADGVAEVISLLRASTNVDFNSYKQATLQRRVQRRIALTKVDDPSAYARLIQADPNELQALFQDVLINVTAFFREPSSLELLRTSVLPIVFRGRSADDPLRIWVPGCSTGEEVYSLTILLLEYMRQTGMDCHCQVFGTDLNEAVLNTARAGIYPESIANEVSQERLRRFFLRTAGGYQISRAVRDLCVFARQNVTRDPPFSKLDLISCRNVLIYLGPALQSKVMRIFHYALKPSGFLMLGMSEAVGTAGELFAPIEKQARIYTRKQARPVIDIGPEVYTDTTAHRDFRPPVPPAGADSSRLVDHLILSRYSPPGVVVSRDLRVIQFRGQTSLFLEHSPGEANLNLMRMTRGGLGLEIRRLIQKADTKSSTVRSEPQPLSDQDSVHRVRLTVTPIQPPGQLERQFLVVFEEVGAPRLEPDLHPAPKEPAKSLRPAQRIKELEREVVATKQYLQTVIEEQEAAGEELKSANEEIQSSNEELQSTNEELLTAKEELQSTNEELTTLNEEMQSRNAELAQSNNDLLNLLNSVNIPILMLGMDLRIRRFTPQAERIFSLLQSDVGRPIGDLRLKLDLADLEDLCSDVVESLGTREREVSDGEGRSYSMSVRPYRTAENRIDGVVVSLFDITERKQTAEARYRRMFEGARDGMIIGEAFSGEIIDVNPHFCRITGFSRQQFLGRHYWEHPAFRNSGIDKDLLEEMQGEESIHRRATLSTAQGGFIQVDVTANLYMEGSRRVMQLNIRDAGPRRDLEDRLRSGDEVTRQAYRMMAVEQIADTLAQDFNDVLTSIMGHSALLRQETGGKAAQRSQQITRAAERAAALTRQLLVFGRGQATMPELLDMNHVIRDVGHLLRVMATKGVDVTFDLHEPLGTIQADRGDVEQILLNLAINARDVVPDGGSVVFRAGNVEIDQRFTSEHPTISPGKYVCLTVYNSGEAEQPAKRHPHVPHRLPKQIGDRGLGLSALFLLVSRNGGALLASTELGRGTTFRVYFPHVEPVEPSVTPETGVHGGTETILLVEDDDSVRSVTAQILESYGYTVLEAASGANALEIAREYPQRIHLLVADALMPHMNGSQLADQLLSSRPELIVLFVSGNPEAKLIEHGVITGVDQFLAKPYTPEALALKVRELLDRNPAA